MPIEIEAKLKVDSLTPIRARLQEQGAELSGEYLETNIFFDTEDRSLLAADKGLRLRRAHEIHSNKDEFILTYKGPRQHGQLKTRDERELTVGNAGDALALLQSLGYVVILAFEKRRQTWKLQDCKVELDELPHLGFFVEIEGPSEPQVLNLRKSLGLSDRSIVKASYTALLMTHLQERGDTTRTVTFSK